MRKPSAFRIAAIATFALSSPLRAQVPDGADQPADTATLQRIELSDGTKLRGWVIDDGNPLRLRLISGQVLELSRSGIQKIERAPGRIVNGRFVREDPNRTRLFFAPTGRGLSQGQGYFAVYEIIVPFLAVAPVDDVVLSGGTPLVFGGGADRPFWFAPKVRVAGGEHLDVAVGAVAVGGLGGGDVAGMAFGVATFGSHAQALTTGIGFGWTGSEWSDRPVVMLGGEVTASSGIKLVTENYILPGEGGLVSLGPRFFGERLTADLGIAIPITSGETIAFPIVNFVWNW